MKIYLVLAGLIPASVSFGAYFDCHAEKAQICEVEGTGEICRMEENISSAFTIKGKRATLATYSVILKGSAHIVPGPTGQPTGFFLRTAGKTVNNEVVSMEAAGTIEANGRFTALIGGVLTTGVCN